MVMRLPRPSLLGRGRLGRGLRGRGGGSLRNLFATVHKLRIRVQSDPRQKVTGVDDKDKAPQLIV